MSARWAVSKVKRMCESREWRETESPSRSLLHTGRLIGCDRCGMSGVGRLLLLGFFFLAGDGAWQELNVLTRLRSLVPSRLSTSGRTTKLKRDLLIGCCWSRGSGAGPTWFSLLFRRRSADATSSNHRSAGSFDSITFVDLPATRLRDGCLEFVSWSTVLSRLCSQG